MSLEVAPGLLQIVVVTVELLHDEISFQLHWPALALMLVFFAPLEPGLNEAFRWTDPNWSRAVTAQVGSVWIDQFQILATAKGEIVGDEHNDEC